MIHARLIRRWNSTSQQIGWFLMVPIAVLNNTWMGTSLDDAKAGVAEINSRREGLGLPLINAAW